MKVEKIVGLGMIGAFLTYVGTQVHKATVSKIKSNDALVEEHKKTEQLAREKMADSDLERKVLRAKDCSISIE